MIVAGLKGGLGNQMFQYALGYRMAHDKGVPFRTDISWFASGQRPYALAHLRIEARPLTNEESNDLKPRTARLPRRLSWLLRFLSKSVYHVRERKFSFDSSILELEPPLYLDGYWQTEKYFLPVADSIRRQFQLAAPMTEARRATADLIKSKGAVAVSVHVRRGDYVASAATLAYHGTCAPEWYERAMTMMAEATGSPYFFIFSDDPAWARANLPSRWPAHFVDPQGDGRDFEDMHLMALCRHHIIANSSFSWWGAWLNPAPDKRVIAPLRWFNQAKLDTTDIVPEAWTRL